MYGYGSVCVFVNKTVCTRLWGYGSVSVCVFLNKCVCVFRVGWTQGGAPCYCIVCVLMCV